MALRILLAEDEPVTRKTAHALLTRAGHAVVAVEEGTAAVAAVAGDLPGFDLVLMDLGLPGLPGDEATRAIRALADPRRAGVRVLMLTATAIPADLERCRICGADGVLPKPLQLDSLNAAAAAAPQTAGPFDETALQQMRELLPADEVSRLIAKAAATLRDYRAGLDAAWVAGDGAAAGTMAHKIAGVAGQYGCAGLRRSAKALEVEIGKPGAAASYAALGAAFTPAMVWLEAAGSR